MNIQQLTQTLATLVDGHALTRGTDFGADYDNDVAGSYLYPMCFIECQPAERTLNANGTVTYQMALLFLDKHTDEDKSDILRAQALTERIMSETLDYLAYTQDSFSLLPSGPAVAVSYATDTIAAGWRVEISVTVAGERCDYKAAFGLPLT